MFRSIVVFLILGFAGSLAWAGEQAVPKDERNSLQVDKDKASYSLGYEWGSNLKRDGLDVDRELLFQGARDAMEGNKPKFGADVMEGARKLLRQRAAIEQRLRYEEAKARNLEEGRAFLEANKSKPGVKALPGGLQYIVIKEGDGPSPKADDKVEIQFRGRLLDGTEFDSSYSRRTPSVVAVNAVIPAWTEALQLMRVGSKWQIFVPADLGYKDRSMSRIPPNSTLIFDLELLSIEK